METNNIFILSIFCLLFLGVSACSDVKAGDMYSPVDTSGNSLSADTGPIDQDLNDEFCPPDSAARNNC